MFDDTFNRSGNPLYTKKPDFLRPMDRPVYGFAGDHLGMRFDGSGTVRAPSGAMLDVRGEFVYAPGVKGPVGKIR